MLHYCGLLKHICNALYILLRIRVSTWYPSSSIWKTFFRMPCSSEQLVTSSYSFLLYENVCIFVFILETCSHSKDDIPLASWCHCFNDNSEITWIFPMLYVSLDLFKIFSLSLFFSSWLGLPWYHFLHIYPVWGLLNFLNI